MTGEFQTLQDQFIVNIQGVRCSRLGQHSFELIFPGGARFVMSEQWLAKYLEEEYQWEMEPVGKESE